MKREETKVCVLRVGGTNCASEAHRAFQEFGFKTETVHLNELIKRRNLMDYQILVFPGGFSFVDYVRAGVIWARWLSAKLGKVLKIPVAHSEGRFLFPKEKEQKLLERLEEEDMLVFRYCDKNGDYAKGSYPTNPNGSFHDIAGICNREGTIFGLMPPPEAALYWWQQPTWTRQDTMLQYSDGKLIFESVVEYLAKKF